MKIEECAQGSKNVKVPSFAPEKRRKRLLLYDLKDMYDDWIKNTTFALILRFLISLLLGQKNMLLQEVLKLSSVTCKVKTKYLIEKTVGSANNRNCMFRECCKCSTTSKKKNSSATY